MYTPFDPDLNVWGRESVLETREVNAERAEGVAATQRDQVLLRVLFSDDRMYDIYVFLAILLRHPCVP